VKVSELTGDVLSSHIRKSGILFRTGPFVCRLQSPIPDVIDGVRLFYADHALVTGDAFADFHIELVAPAGLRRWLRRQVLFRFDGRAPFLPLPYEQAFPMLEWGLNWCVANHAHQYLILHAAVVERGGHAVILPGEPGAGKSTLCAGLVARGWRLLSDELALISTRDLQLTPLARPISLKNASIEVIRRFAPQATLGPVIQDTRKGTLSHVKPPGDSVERAGERATAAWLVFPRYEEGAPAEITPRPRGRSLMRVAGMAFNYSLLGLTGFETLTRLVDACACYDFRYSDLDQAVAVFEELFQDHESGTQLAHIGTTGA
jgi:HprK-related kinase A